MYNCIIIDDEQPARRLIEHYCNKVNELNVVGNYKSAVDAYNILATNTIDIIFLDIQMPDITGIDFVKTLKNQSAKIIFTTAYRDFAIEGFELDAIDYLLKPIEFPRFLRAINKIKEFNFIANTKNVSKDYIFIKSNKKTYKVNYTDILFIKSESEYINYYTKTLGKIMVHGALKNVTDQLPKTSFFRVHRSYIINTDAIVFIEGNRINIEDTFIPIGENYKSEFLKIWR